MNIKGKVVNTAELQLHFSLLAFCGVGWLDVQPVEDRPFWRMIDANVLHAVDNMAYNIPGNIPGAAAPVL